MPICHFNQNLNVFKTMLLHLLILTALTITLSHSEIVGHGLADQVIDLSWPFSERSVYWPNAKRFIFVKKVAAKINGQDWYASNDFCAGEHGGTHFDAPYHFNQHGWKVDDVPMKHLIVPGVCITLKRNTFRQEAYSMLNVEDIIEWETLHGAIPSGSAVLINFGWSKHYYTPSYLNLDGDKLSFPGISKTAAEFLVQRRVVGVGVDTASVDPGNSTTFRAHRVLAAANIYNMENLRIPDDFPDTDFTLFVLPMNIEEGTGAPLRVVAVRADNSKGKTAMLCDGAC